MSNDTLLQILDELKDVVKNGGIIKVNGNGGISTYSIPDSNNDNQAENSLQNILDELTKKDKDGGISYKSDSDDAECYPINDGGDMSDDTNDDCFECYDYNPERVTESEMDEVINKLSEESQALKDKIDRLSKALAKPSTIRSVGKEQYHLMVLQLTAMLNYYNILSERIVLLNYDGDNDLD